LLLIFRFRLMTERSSRKQIVGYDDSVCAIKCIPKIADRRHSLLDPLKQNEIRQLARRTSDQDRGPPIDKPSDEIPVFDRGVIPEIIAYLAPASHVVLGDKFEAKAPIIGLADYGEILTLFNRETPPRHRSCLAVISTVAFRSYDDAMGLISAIPWSLTVLTRNRAQQRLSEAGSNSVC
jgi:hypothetical protein